MWSGAVVIRFLVLRESNLLCKVQPWQEFTVFGWGILNSWRGELGTVGSLPIHSSVASCPKQMLPVSPSMIPPHCCTAQEANEEQMDSGRRSQCSPAGFHGATRIDGQCNLCFIFSSISKYKVQINVVLSVCLNAQWLSCFSNVIALLKCFFFV